VTEPELVARLRRRDDAAVRAFVERYDRRLHGLVRRYVPSAHVEDVVQDTWIAALAGIDRFAGHGSLEGWLFRIAANIARTRGVREARSVPVGDVPESPTREPGPEERAVEQARRIAIGAAIRRLSPTLRSAIELRDLHGLSPCEVRETLGIDDSAQRVRLHRARRAVRREIALAFAD
jgi:RNA polymerase sigma-70 factor (ECF subfamily)